MISTTLNRYIFRKSLMMIVYFCLGASAITFLADFTEFANRNGDLPEFSAGLAATAVMLRVPFILQIAIPFIILFATIATLIGLNQKYELVIARASGVSAWQFLRPVWLAALIAGLFTVFVINPVASYGFSFAEQIEGEWRSKPSGNPLTAREYPWLRQTGEDGGSILIGARRSAQGGLTLFQPSFLEIDADGELVRRIDSNEARLAGGEWQLQNATVTRPGEVPESLGQMQIASTLDEAVVTDSLSPPEMVPFLSLPKQIDTAQSFGIAAYPFRMHWHSLIALPALLVVMTLIAATVSLRFARFGQSASMILGGIIAGFALYVVISIAKSFGSAGLISPVVAAWFPVVAGGMFGTTFLLYREDG
ncbi:MAG: LPS export ABC transporter permease LptG [Pseudomonadota bacterium]